MVVCCSCILGQFKVQVLSLSAQSEVSSTLQVVQTISRDQVEGEKRRCLS